MMAKDETLPARAELTGTQKALLEQRLQRARLATSRSTESRPSIPRRKPGGEIPLSFAQERLWFLDQLEPGSAVYNVCQAVRMRGPLNLAALEQALQVIVQRHESLRTNFVAADGCAVQVIAPTVRLPMPIVDLSSSSDINVEAELQRLMQREARRPFDLERDSLIRALLISINGNDHVFVLNFHHIISDGWSVGVFFRELTDLYVAFAMGKPNPLPELPIQFADFVLWERQNLAHALIEKQLEYWRSQLGGGLPVLELPTDQSRAATLTSGGASHAVTLPRALAQAVKALGQNEGATLFMTLLAAFQTLLYRWSGQEDFLVGSVVAGRRKVELERMIGFFVSTLVIRGDLSGNPNFRALLGRVRETTLGALANQDLPFERLVQELRPDRTLSRNPLFQVMFVLQNAPTVPPSLADISFESLEIDNGTAKFDLTLSMIETPQGLRAVFEYNAGLFHHDTIVRLSASFQTLLGSIVAEPDLPIGQLAVLNEAERHQLLVTWNNTALPYERNARIHDLFEDQAHRTPTAIALVGAFQRLTYAELNEQADRLAKKLQERGVGPDTLVGIFLERTPQLLVAILGVLKSGGAYVPLDPNYPLERLAFVIRDTRMPVIVSQRKLLAELPAQDTDVILLDENLQLVRERQQPAPQPATTEVTATNLAYAIYTSGSTGQPKGVGVMHRGVVALIAWARQLYKPDEMAGVLFSTSASFDVSVFESLTPLCLGGKVIVVENILQVGALKSGDAVTLMSGVPSAMAEVLRAGIMPESVRTINVAGEPCPQSLVEALYERGHIERVYDVYGPTETTVYSTGSLRAPGGRPTIGRPLPNEHAYILDAHFQPVPIGVRGELYIGGDKVARGYLNQPELTREKFLEIPLLPGERLYRTGDAARYRPDGAIEYLGRLDRQVKIRGFRIEPAEIEAILSRHPAVKECVVVPREDSAGGKTLVAYVVSRETPAPTSDSWRAFIEDKVPDFQVPSAFVVLEAMPLMPNGKLDKQALPAPDNHRPELQREYVAPRDDVEEQLVGIWENVLGVSPVGVQDRFFDLGGHSLLAVRMAAQLEKKFGRKLPVASIFQHRTIEQLARLVRGNDVRYSPATSLVEIQAHGSRPPIYLVHGVGGGMFWGYSNLARHMGSDQPIYAFKSRGLDGLPEFKSIEEMAANYVADLRAHRPHGPYQLGGYCFGGVVAYEMACQLQASGEQVTLLSLINCSPPNSTYFSVTNRRSLGWQFRFLGNLIYWLICFVFRWSMRERVEFVRWKTRLLWKRPDVASTPDGVDLTVPDVDEMVNLAAYSQDQRRLWQLHMQALKDHRPKEYRGDVALFRTRGHPLMCSFDEYYGWGDFVRGRIALNRMPGGHGSILDEPHVRAVARSLNQCAQKAIKPTGGGQS